jgi:hypothetical protein
VIQKSVQSLGREIAHYDRISRALTELLKDFIADLIKV